MRRILVLGSGFVATALVKHFCRRPDQSLTIASNILEDAKQLAAIESKQCTAVFLDVSDEPALAKLIREHDIVVSLIPWTLHPIVARLCVQEKVNMVTASYITPTLQEFDLPAKEANIAIFNEIGFDPGLDHLGAMSIIDDVLDHGGKVESFVSMAAGLPVVEHADNPLGYKFSWSPKGVLLAAVSPAQYLKDGEVVKVEGGRTYYGAKDMPADMFRGLRLEGVPNRDSIQFKEPYKLHDAHTILRGTMRFPGFATMIVCFSEMNLLSQDPCEELSKKGLKWNEFVASQMGCAVGDVKNVLKSRLEKVWGDDKRRLREAFRGLEWLEIMGDTIVPADKKQPIDALCAVLEEKLAFNDGERDLLLLHHEFIVDFDGRKERRTSKIIVSGDPYGMDGSISAMSRLVGVPCAVATEAVLDGAITRKGVFRPTEKEVYLPLLERLKETGISMIEDTEEL
uniref:Saccharopine dehydrogenase n=1 Tax=Stygiella incarcerata TaxID=1712417 RepID=A0A192ZIS8_9EUKA|nr:saccharopine dehydrogenase [Stygiella incarcerata]|eukprot:TRINITY_DN383_c0_g1_i3.p1 TRINITY_DN383_c0_g1~~TRINITY_DN383_c0_g1_i3.p1  ORF type:complete len:455 (-),score=137.43 TRINITY_DN383_c0_g1_i3:151-1515(-)